PDRLKAGLQQRPPHARAGVPPFRRNPMADGGSGPPALAPKSAGPIHGYKADFSPRQPPPPGIANGHFGDLSPSFEREVGPSWAAHRSFVVESCLIIE